VKTSPQRLRRVAITSILPVFVVGAVIGSTGSAGALALPVPPVADALAGLTGAGLPPEVAALAGLTPLPARSSAS
jgi:hypothetical protein